MDIETAYMYVSWKNEWVGVVHVGRKVLTAGCMATEEGIKAWLAQVVATRAWETGMEPPDLYDTRH